MLRRCVLFLVLSILLCSAGGGVSLGYSGDVRPKISITNPPLQDSDGYTGGAIGDMVLWVNQELVQKKYVSAGSEFMGLTVTVGSGVNPGTVVVIDVDYGYYRGQSTSRRKEIMSVLLNGVENSNISRINKVKIFNELVSLDESTASLVRQLNADVGVDFAGAYSYFKPFSGPLGIFLGLFSIVVLVLIGFMLLIDFSFLSFSVLQFMLWDGKSDKGRFVSREAVRALKEAESADGYSVPLLLYMKYKSMQLVVIFICLLYLLGGKMFEGLAYLIDFFSGLV